MLFAPRRAFYDTILDVSPSVEKVGEKVEGGGGEIIQPPIQIPAGHIAVIVDSEGNKIGIHSANL